MLSANNVVDVRNARALLPGVARNYTPLNERVRDYIKPSLASFFAAESEYADAFDLFEYLMSLVIVDIESQAEELRWVPTGIYSWRRGSMSEARFDVVREMQQNADANGGDWKILGSGMFSGSEDRFQRAVQLVDDVLARRNYD